MRTRSSGGRDRILAAFEVTGLGVWVGAIIEFAFVEAPRAFHLVAPLDVGRFSELIADSIGELTVLGYVLGGIALLAVIARASFAGDRRYDMVRGLLIALALGVSVVHATVIMPAIGKISDVRSPAFTAMHHNSSTVYSVVLLLTLAALIMGAARAQES
jgi:hypothetical protein